MKRLPIVLLTAMFALPACSAEDGANQTTAAAPVDAPASNSAPVKSDEPIVLAQADPEPASTTPTTPSTTPAPTQATAPAARADIVEGRHYRVLRPAQPTSSSPDKIEVAEMFMYSCPHCFSFEPFIQSYLAQKPAYINFIRVPTSFNAVARVHAKAFYVAETLGILDDIHTEFFKAFHVEKNRLGNEKAIIEFFVSNGVERAEVEKALNSFAIDTKLRQADSLTRRYRIDSVPALVINGKYVTSGSMTGSIEKLREVVNYLTAKEAAEL